MEEAGLDKVWLSETQVRFVCQNRSLGHQGEVDLVEQEGKTVDGNAAGTAMTVVRV